MAGIVTTTMLMVKIIDIDVVVVDVDSTARNGDEGLGWCGLGGGTDGCSVLIEGKVICIGGFQFRILSQWRYVL